MVPWSIGAVAVFYGIVAACSAASAWNVITGASAQALVWPLLWVGVSGSAMLGLVLLKPWARTVAIWGFVGLIAMTVSFAGVLVAAGRPGLGLAMTLAAGVYVLAIRYLRRPIVKAWFAEAASDQ